MSAKGPKGPFALPRVGVIRLGLATGAAALLAILAVQLARVDGSLGRAYGPDRLIKALDDSDPSGGVPDHAATNARKALATRPIDGRAYRVLGQLAMEEGDDARAGDLLGIAAERWPRDRMAQALLAQRAFADNDSAAAVMHLDALLRVAPDIRPAMFAEMVGLLEFPEFRSALIDRMAVDPPWRAALVRTLRASDTPPAPALAFLEELASRQALKDDELQTRVALLGRAGQPQQAREAWLASVDPAAHNAADLVFDGGFEHSEVDGGYGWQMRPAAGLAIGADISNPHSGDHSLAITFHGRAVQFANLQQSLALPAGTYRLSASADNRTGSSRPFVLQLACDSAKTPIAELPLPQSPGWQMAEASFSVTASCPAQRLVLRHTGRNAAERQIRGTVYVDDIQIVPISD